MPLAVGLVVPLRRLIEFWFAPLQAAHPQALVTRNRPDKRGAMTGWEIRNRQTLKVQKVRRASCDLPVHCEDSSRYVGSVENPALKNVCCGIICLAHWHLH